MKDILLKRLKDLKTREEKYNFTREFLQELVLQILDRRRYFKNLAFVGGTALRIVYDLPRFSEDLDFCLINKSGFKFPAMLKTIVRELELAGFIVSLSQPKDKTVNSAFIRFERLLFELGLSDHKNEKLFVKLEIDSRPPAGYQTEVKLINKNFMFKIVVYDLASLFAGKLHAILFRKFSKARDYYDLLWLITKKAPVNLKLLNHAAKQTENKDYHITMVVLKEMLSNRIRGVNFNKLKKEILPFLVELHEQEYFSAEHFLRAVEGLQQ